jgi:Galactocerebrosidase, C-terminal lectin domain
MNRHLVLACVSGILLAVTAGSYGQGSTPMTVDIAALAHNLEPEFTIGRTGQGAPAQWAIVTDPTAAGGRAIAQTSTDKTDYRFPLAIYKPYSGKNVEVSVRFKPVSGSVDQAGGIAVRLQTPDDYYVVRANALEDNVRFYRVVKGKREQLAGANTKVATNTWHMLTLKAEGDRFTVSYDGKELYTARDTTFAEAGKVALWTKADSVTNFDNLTIRPLPEGGK